MVARGTSPGYRWLGKAGVAASRFSLGTMTFGEETDYSEARRQIALYRDYGGNLIDTANVYGGGAAERMIGRALGRVRGDMIVASKVRFPRGNMGPNNRGASRYHIVREVEASLRRLRTDRLDVLYLHCWDPYTDISETASVLSQLIQSGKVLYVGLSNYAAWQIGAYLNACGQHRGLEPIGVQVEYSLLQRGVEYEVIPACRYHEVAVLTWGPLAGGVLTGKYRIGSDSTIPTGGSVATRIGGE